ncbi:MAG: tandem-95 repeat protein [Acidimicrobiales bacterium]|nr:tandem-95 repeat protein [Acidimicrobiales bacterium]
MGIKERWNAVGAIALSFLMVTGLVAAAMKADGFRETLVDLNDGGVWVTRPGQAGRLNTQIASIELAISGSKGVDVAQYGDDVIMFDPGEGEMVAVNAALADKGDVRKIPKASTVALGAAVGVVSDPSKGRIWVTGAGQLGQLDPGSVKPSIRLEGDETEAVVAAGYDGAAHIYQPGADEVLTAEPEAKPSTTSIDGPVSLPAITAVGDRTILLDGRSGELVVVGGPTIDLSEFGEGLALQQPGPARPEVLVGTDDHLLAVPLGGGEPVVLGDGGTGAAVQPVWAEGCSYGAWGDDPSWVRWCEGEEQPAEAHAIEDDAVRPGNGLVYRVNRNRVVLNDRASDVNLLMDLPEPEIVKDWDQALDKNREQDDEREQTTQKQQADCSDSPKAPATQDDEAGTRAERPVIVPVLENDESDRCDVLVIEPLTERDVPGADVADVAIVDDGAALQVTPAAGRTAPITVNYRAVGKGDSSPATVTVNVSSEAENGEPEPVEDTTVVESGQTVRHNVLTNDRDPDGDALSLTEVRAGADGSTPQFQADGVVTYTAPGGFVGTVTLPYVVEDDLGLPAEGELTIRVQAAGANLAPKARNDRLEAFVGTESKLDLLANDTDPNDDDLIVVEVDDADESLGLTWDQDGTMRVEPTAAGTYWVRYEISDDEATAEGWVSVRVSESEGNSEPVAVRDDAVARPSVPALVDLVANDLDADGDLLAVTSLSVPPGSGLSVELLEMRVARITASAAFQVPAVVGYSVTDGDATASGRLVVRPYRLSGLDQPPVTIDDTATVRAGNATSIEVLRNDLDPEGEQLEIVEVEEVDEAQGRLFVQDDELRFKAASGARRSVTASYTVRDPADNTAAGQVAIEIIPEDQPNQPPTPPRLDARVFSGRSVAIPVPLVGLDPDGDTVSIVGVTTDGAPRKGSVEVTGEGFLYRADKGSSGADSFTFRVEDPAGEPATGRVSLVIAPVPTANTAPAAVPDKVTMAPGQSRAIEVLANDVDVDEDALSLLEGEKDGPTSPPEGMGSVRVEDNRIVFDAPGSVPGDLAQTSFTYGVADGRGGSARGVVTVTIDGGDTPNDPPVAGDDFLTLQLIETTVSVDVLANDRDPDDPDASLDVEVLDYPAAAVRSDGTLSVDLGTEPASFVYEVTDADGDTARALVSIPVAETLPPVAALDELEMEAGSTESIPVLENDDNPGGDRGDLEVVRVVNARGGETELKGDEVEFTSETDWLGEAGFSYVVSNGTDESVGNVRITLTGQDLEPEFASTAVDLPAGGARELDLEALTTDLDTEEHEFSGLGGTGGGIDASIEGSTLRISAANDARGATADLEFVVADGKNEVPATVPVTVSENQAPLPVAVDDTGETIQGEPVTVDVIANDVDPLGEGLRLVGRADVSGGGGVGSASIAGDGSITFSPAESFFGSALVTYTVRDDADTADREVSGTLRVTVFGRPSAPPAPSGTAESHLVRLTWGVPANNGAPITGYVIEADVGGVRSQSATNAATIDGLTNAQPYRFRVAALNKAAPDAGAVRADQWSPWSPALIPDQFPDQPIAPVVEFNKDANAGGAGGVLQVRWTPPTVDGSPIKEYRVKSSGGETRTFPAGTTSTEWAGLNNGTPYTFSVQAENDAGPSEWSSASGPQTPAGVPAPVTGVTAQRVADSRNDAGGWASVGWSPSADNGDPAGLTYRVTVSPGGQTKTTDVTSIEWSGLGTGTQYTFTVVAYNKAGDGQGGSSGGVYPEGKPVAPAAPQFLPGNGKVNMFNVSTPDSRGPGAVSYEYSTAGAGSGFRSFNGSSFNLANGTTVGVWVRACKATSASGDAVGCSGATQATNQSTGSSQVTPFGPPPLSASVNDRTITWTWGSTAAGVDSYNVVGQSGNEGCGNNCFRKTFGYAERRCLRVDAVGQGVTRPSGEVCKTTADPPQPKVTIRKGGGTSQPDCDTSACAWIRADLANFGGGPYTLQCQSTHGGGWSTYWSGSVSSPDRWCYFGYPGEQVRLVVNGTTSNTITW